MEPTIPRKWNWDGEVLVQPRRSLVWRRHKLDLWDGHVTLLCGLGSRVSWSSEGEEYLPWAALAEASPRSRCPWAPPHPENKSLSFLLTWARELWVPCQGPSALQTRALPSRRALSSGQAPTLHRLTPADRLLFASWHRGRPRHPLGLLVCLCFPAAVGLRTSLFPSAAGPPLIPLLLLWSVPSSLPSGDDSEPSFSSRKPPTPLSFWTGTVRQGAVGVRTSLSAPRLVTPPPCPHWLRGGHVTSPGQ